MDSDALKKDQVLASRLSIILVVIIFTLKITVSFFTNSLSFFAELSDSLMDILAVSITFFALREGQKDADFKHMFGHYKINSLAAFLQGLLILVLYGYIMYTSVTSLILRPNQETENSVLAAITLTITLVIVFIFSTIIVKIGKRTKNPLIIAQGVNFRGDFYRNITFIVGLIVVSFGIYWLDAVLALIFSVISIFEAFKVLQQSFFELTDANFIQQDALEDVENKIQKLPGVLLESLKIKSTLTNLDAVVTVDIDNDQLMMTATDIVEEIKEIICRKFPDFTCNSLIILNPKHSIHKDSFPYLVAKIQEYSKEEPKITNVHNISIDRFEDMMFIQYHVDIDPSMSLKDAHDVVSDLEEKTKLGIQAIIPQLNPQNGENFSIEVMSHIEPESHLQKIHDHKMFAGLESPEILEKIKEIIHKIDGVREIKNINIQNESDNSVYLSLTIMLDGQMNIFHSHDLAEMVERSLFYEIPNLKRCFIHTEPF